MRGRAWDAEDPCLPLKLRLGPERTRSAVFSFTAGVAKAKRGSRTGTAYWRHVRLKHRTLAAAEQSELRHGAARRQRRSVRPTVMQRSTGPACRGLNGGRRQAAAVAEAAAAAASRFYSLVRE